MATKADLIFLEDIGESGFEPFKFDETATVVDKAAIHFIDALVDAADKKDVYSSGAMTRGIEKSELRQDGNSVAIDISAPEYISYQDEGVDGWAKSRGSRFKFKTRGVDPSGAMVKSIKEWQKREVKSNQTFKKYAVSKREVRALDLETRKATTAAYMIKRQGIEGKNFIQEARQSTTDYFEQELGEAVTIDINNNLFK